MKFISKVVVGCLSLFQICAHAKIMGPKRYDSEGLLTYFSGEFYTTTENFDNNAKARTLGSGNSYTVVDMPFGARYNLLPNWAIDGELKATYAQSKSSTPLTGGERTNSEIHEARLSSDMLIETRGFDIIPELEVIIPFQKIDDTTDTVLVGERAQQIIGRLHIQTEFGNSDFFGFLGYNMRDGGRSQLLPWSAGLGINWGPSFIGGRVFGFQSMTDDRETNSPFLRDQVIARVNGGSRRFYSINPSALSAEALWFLKFKNQWQVQANFGLDLAGENYSKGIFGGLAIVLDWGYKEREFRARPRGLMKQPKGSGLAVESDRIDFKEETTESNDQKYFEAPPLPVVKPAPRAKPRQRIQSPSDDQIQNQLDDTEMQIELKRKKRK